LPASPGKQKSPLQGGPSGQGTEQATLVLEKTAETDHHIPQD